MVLCILASTLAGMSMSIVNTGTRRLSSINTTTQTHDNTQDNKAHQSSKHDYINVNTILGISILTYTPLSRRLPS
jgi:hypothetical protein